MPQWTREQRQAIDMKGNNILVSAAAGSGKTAVLVERIIKLITEDLIDINKLLIVTFTNAAAGEMRSRILDALTEKIEEGARDEGHLRKQISNLNKSYIMTLHSFCIDVIKRYFHKIDIDPSFRIGNAAELGIIMEEALDELLEEEYEKGDKLFVELLESYSGDRDDSKIKELILRVYDFIQSQPRPLEWLKNSAEEFNITKEELEESKWVKGIKEGIKLELEGLRDLIMTAIKLCQLENGPIEYKEALVDDLRNIEGLIDALDNGLDEFHEAISSISHQSFKSIRGERKNQIDGKIQEEVKNLRDKYKKGLESIIEKILTLSMEEYHSQLVILYPRMKYLYALVLRFNDKYMEKKAEKGILDFNDLEHLALKILEDEDARRDYRERFEYIFVDEYQDSNIIQEAIIDRIKRENNLFLVGDVKQSIYRFRLADPTLFIEKFHSFSRDSGINRRIDLSKNFRSRKEILDCINYIFKNIMTKELGEIDYDESSYLYDGLTFKTKDDLEVELNIIDNKLEKAADLDEELQEMTAIEVEARFVAKKIKDLIGKETYNPKKGDFEKIDYKDIVVLLRSPKNWAKIFTEVFIREGIPVYAEDTTGYFDSLEIDMFIDLLRVIDNKRQDIPLLGVLRSPIGNFTTDELIDIRIACREGSFIDALVYYSEKYNDDLSQKTRRFLTDIEKWSNHSRMMKLDEFIWYLLLETGYYYYVGAMPGGAQRQANLRILMDRASAFEKSIADGLFLFIRFIDKLKVSRGDMGAAKILSENDNVVRIMSIHKSKGLEFPVVFCCGLGKQFNLRDSQEDVLLHKDLGLGPKYVDVEKRIYCQSLPQIAIKNRIRVENLSEEMRILYVALTRAIDKLILVGSSKDIESQCKTWQRGCSAYNLIAGKSFLDWICSALIRHRDGHPIRQVSTISYGEIIDDDVSLWKINILDRNHILREDDFDTKYKRELMERLLKCELDAEENFREEINRRFIWEYQHKVAVGLPSKLAVSDIKRSDRGIEDILYKLPVLISKPMFLQGEKSFTKAEIGTIIHFVMQHLDLRRVSSKEEIEEQINSLVARDLLTEEESKVVDIERILSFFGSEIGQRILMAKKVEREVPFVLRKRACEVLEGVDNCEEYLLIQGIIDCYIEEDGGLVLIDYKTGDIKSREDIQEVVNRYKGQMDLYKEALEKITNKRVLETYLYLFDINTAVKIV